MSRKSLSRLPVATWRFMITVAALVGLMVLGGIFLPAPLNTVTLVSTLGGGMIVVAMYVS